jgi:hypothetical protein
MWWFMLLRIHATVTGVLAFVIPFGNGDKDSTSSVLQHFLHKPVGFLILPLLHWQIRDSRQFKHRRNYCSTLQYWNRFRINRRKTIGYLSL